MSRKNRLIIAVVLSIVVLFAAAGVWAAPKFQGTVPPVPQQVPLIPVTGECLLTVNMNTAIFTVVPDDCIYLVELINDPAATYTSAPEGLGFVGDTFKATTYPEDALVEACYAYPPELAEKEASIHRLNVEAKPNVWVEIPGAVTGEGTICVTSAAGVFSLIGKP